MALLPVNFSLVNMERFTVFSFKSLIVSLLFSAIVPVKDVMSAESLKSYDKLYEAGMEAYHQERWFECFEHVSKALELYNEYRESYIICGLKCQNKQVAVNVEASVELNFYKIALERSHCLKECRLERSDQWPDDVSSEVQAQFNVLQPYDYLQICAFKLDKFDTAAAAAFTFLVKNPDHEVMRSNVEFYHSMPQVKPEFFVNLEKKLYEVYYDKIRDSYAVEEYEDTVVAAENAIQSYLQEFQRCEVMCEGPYQHTDSPDFYIAIADHWLSVLKCQYQCTDKLSFIQGEKVPDFFPELFNYLQFSQYMLNNLEAAAHSAATYLLFKPDDESMIKNRQFYISDLGVDPGAFVPHESGRQHLISQQMRWEMLQSVSADVVPSDAPVQPTTSNTVSTPDPPPATGVKTKKKKGDLEDDNTWSGNTFRDQHNSKSVSPSKQIGVQDEVYTKALVECIEEGGDKDEVYTKVLEDFMLEKGLLLVDEQMQGDNTMVVDGLLTDEQCLELSQLVKVKMADEGSTSQGGVLTLARAVELTSELKLAAEEARLYLLVSDESRSFTQRYFNFRDHLYNSHTKIVCHAETEQPEGFLADECLLQADSSCVTSNNLEAQHTFSAVLHLNDNYKDGEFFFSNDDFTPKSLVKPKCGRLVAYDTSILHGVKAVTTGTRCSLVMGFTFSKIRREMAQEEGSMVLQAIHSRERPLQNPILRSLVEEKGYNIVMTESELKGPERFTSDKMATEAQCEALINLANDGGIVGDGYKNAKFKNSPHTIHEEFVGLTIKRAIQEGGIQGDGYIPKKGGGVNKVSSPHTANEVFQGLTVIRAAKLLEEGGVDGESVRMYLELSQNSLDIVEKYFNLTKPLYFDYTHLVCRTALDDSMMERQDLSHPVHSDNCIIQPDGECKKVRPAYIQRDYSAILYLNEDFLGGEFFFAHTNLTVQSTLKPKCGRLVGFNAANYHGVQAVLKGQRCAIAMWYTLDPSYNEAAHAIAWNVVKKMSNPHQPTGPAATRHDGGEL